MTLWTDSTFNTAREGMLAEASNPVTKLSKIAEGAIRVGLLLEQGTAHNQIKPVAALPVLDADSITGPAVALGAGVVELGFADFAGATGPKPMGVAQRYTLLLNAHADWLASNCQVVYEEPGGAEVTEDLLVPAGGNVTLTTQGVGRRFKLAGFAAGGGVNRTVQIGTNPTAYGLNPDHFLGVGIYDRMAYPSATATVTIDSTRPVAVLSKGRIWVKSESAVLVGAPAYARMVLAGADVRGQFTAEPTANFARLPQAHFVTAADAGGLAVLEIGG